MMLAAAAGWSANAFFCARFLHQWIASERARRSVAPAAFWWLSLGGSLLLAWYLVVRGEPVLLVGVALNAAIYARNLWALSRPGFVGLSSLPLALLTLGGVALAFGTGFLETRAGWSERPSWLLVSVVGQGLWSARFVLQWLATERQGHSHFPRAFWWLSLLGNALLLGYALHRRDAILIAGYLPGPLAHVRNLALSLRGARHAPAAAHARAAPRATRALQEPP